MTTYTRKGPSSGAMPGARLSSQGTLMVVVGATGMLA